MQLELTEYYRNAVGTIFGPVEAGPNSTYMVRFTGLSGQKLPAPMYFNADGSCVANPTSAFNLVAPVATTKPEVEPALAVALANGGPMGTDVVVKVEPVVEDLEPRMPAPVYEEFVPKLPLLAHWTPPLPQVKAVDWEAKYLELLKEVTALCGAGDLNLAVHKFLVQHPEID